MDVPKLTEGRKLSALTFEREGQWSGPFCFIQSADTQFGMIDAYIKKVEEYKVTWDKEIESTRKAIQAANRMQPKPRFFVVCGDLVDAMPGTMHRAAQEHDWQRVFTELDNSIPLVCVCGNHDIGNTPTRETVEMYKKSFGSDDYFTFWCGGTFNIVINSQYFADPSLVQDLADEQLKWIDEQLVLAKKKKAQQIIVFQHIPLFVKDANEDKIYFNYEKVIRMKMLDKFVDAGVAAIFCGHYHRNAGGTYRGMELVVTSAIGATLGEDPSGLRVVNVYKDKIEHTYYDLDNIPKDPLLKK